MNTEYEKTCVSVQRSVYEINYVPMPARHTADLT